jgi:hypothetical protein
MLLQKLHIFVNREKNNLVVHVCLYAKNIVPFQLHFPSFSAPVKTVQSHVILTAVYAGAVAGSIHPWGPSTVGKLYGPTALLILLVATFNEV